MDERCAGKSLAALALVSELLGCATPPKRVVRGPELGGRAGMPAARGPRASTARATPVENGARRELAVVQVALSSFSSCALLVDHSVWCWGDRHTSSTSDGLAWQVPIAGVTELVAAGERSFAVTARGELFAWGSLRVAGAFISTAEPVLLIEREARGVAASENGVCARLEAGAVDCWEAGGRQRRVLDAGARAVAVAEDRACALGPGATVRCWAPGGAPTAAAELSGAVELGANGAVVCGLRSDGAVRCSGSAAPEAERTLGSGLSGLRSSSHALCGLLPVGAPHCVWASHGAAEASLEPPARWVGPHDVVSDVRRSAEHACLVAQGAVTCWGDDAFNALGDPGRESARVAHVHLGDSAALAETRAVAVGSNHTCAIGEDERLRCWGDNAWGQLGLGDRRARQGPELVRSLGAVTRVGASSKTTCAVSGGTLFCFGAQRWLPENAACSDDEPGQPCTLVPVPVASDVQELAVGDDQLCFTTRGGQVHCVGDNALGQLGTGDFSSSNGERPVLLADGRVLDDVTSLFAFERHSCARRRSGQLVCWGANDPFEQGRPYNGPERIPRATPVPGFEDAVSVSRQCVLAADGSARCWGKVFDDPRAFSFTPRAVGVCGAERLASGPGPCFSRDGDSVECLGQQVYADARWQSRELRARTGPLRALVGWADRLCALSTSGALACVRSDAGEPTPEFGTLRFELAPNPAPSASCPRAAPVPERAEFPPEPARAITAYDATEGQRPGEVGREGSGRALSESQARRLLRALNDPRGYTSVVTCHEPTNLYQLSNAAGQHVGTVEVGDCVTLESRPLIPAQYAAGGNIVTPRLSLELGRLCRELGLRGCGSATSAPAATPTQR